jgi:hypothetical protein
MRLARKRLLYNSTQETSPRDPDVYLTHQPSSVMKGAYPSAASLSGHVASIS